MTTQLDSSSSSPKPSAAGRLWTFLRILNVRLRFIFIMVLVGLVSAYWDNLMNYYDRWRRPKSVTMTEATASGIEYFCPMHPNIVRADPGQCPICGMPLSKREKGHARELAADVLAQVQLTPWKVQMGRIATSPVDYRLLGRELRTVGIVNYNETRRAFIASRIKGRIDKLLVNYTGQRVEKGDPLVSIYSPDLLVAQEELLTAFRASESTRAGGNRASPDEPSFTEAPKRKLLLWGITEAQIDEVLRRGAPETHLTIYSPLSGIVTEKNVLEGHYVDEGDNLYTIADLSNVWMEAKIFEDESGGVDVGTAVEVTSTAYPNEVFAGRIAFVAYTVDSATRTVSARVEIANPDLKLKPGMYAHAVVRVPVGSVTEVAFAPDGNAVTDKNAAHVVDTSALLRAYLSMTAGYVEDKADPSAVDSLVAEAQKLAAGGRGAVSEKASAVAEVAKQLPGKNLQAQRGVLKSLSEPMIQLARASPPPDLKLYVVHCPMVSAEWLQDSSTVANPFMGSEMPKCGTVTGTITTSDVVESERFVTGYHCPIYPDRIYEKPELCPIDKFPLRLAKVEKTLAVPVSAVINTGTRKVVYRETEPGIFDMLEIKVGNRAGEFYPVVSGLRQGDRVATAGAFLVDAENRLNPAASAQYFGASGGPQSSQQDKQ